MVEVTRRRGPRRPSPTPSAGDVIEIEQLDGEHFGRIGAQTAKQIILQRIREVERDQVFDQFASREGELITGSVNRVEPRAIILDVGKGVEAILATSEQSPLEHYRIGQPVKAYVLEVRRSARGPQILVQPDPQGLPEAPVRARGAGDPRGHRRDQGDRPRGRQPLQGRGRVAPGGARPGRRDGRPARRAGPGRRRRARRREDRRHPVERGPVACSSPTRCRRPRSSASTSTRSTGSRTSPCPSGCSRSRSAARARTRASPRA